MDCNPSILIIGDDAEVGAALAELLCRQGYTAQAVASAEEAEEIVSRCPRLRLLFMDLVMPGVDGMTLLVHLKEQRPELAVIMISGPGTLAAAVETIRRGADDFITKPFERTTVLKKVQYLLELQRLREKVAELESSHRLMRFGRSQFNRHAGRVSKTENQANEFPMFPLKRFEKYAIEQALRVSGNHKSRAVKILGISRPTLYRKMRQHGIPL